jgi:integrase/recombinase XerD
METVELRPLFHKERACIGIYSQLSGKLNYHFQKKAGAKWSQSNKCWYVPCTEYNYELPAKVLKGIAVLEVVELKKYLIELKKTGAHPNVANQNVTLVKTVIENITPVPARSVQKINPLVNLSQENYKELRKYSQQLVLKSYSPSTIKTYTNEFMQFLQTIKDVPANEFSVQRIKDYLQYCFEKLKLSENTLHSRMNALKFYFEQVLKREKFFWEIPRPKKQFILPKVLGESELKRLFNAIQNKKHKAILFTAYSAGLRVSEVVNLELKHIDRSRMQIFIERAKGKKDRYVMLSPVLLDILSNYYKTSKPRPVKYIFEGPEPGTPYSSKSMQKIFQMAREKAGIHKALTFHSLRHSFATHLLEKGVDIKYIKDLLGHFDIKTTARYLHVKKEQLVNIVSPLDNLFLGEEII